MALRHTLAEVFSRGAAAIHSDHFNDTDEVTIKVVKVLSRNPVLLMNARSNRPDEITLHESGIHLEPKHVSGAAVLGIPVARDLSGICFVQHGVEEGLVRKASGERAPSTLAYQLKLTLSCRA